MSSGAPGGLSKARFPEQRRPQAESGGRRRAARPAVYLNNSYDKMKSVIMLTSLGAAENYLKLFHKESLLRAGFPGQPEWIFLDVT